MILLHILGGIRAKVNNQISYEWREDLCEKCCMSVQGLICARIKPFPAQLCVTDLETAKAPVSAGLQMSLGNGRHWQEAGGQEERKRRTISPPSPLCWVQVRPIPISSHGSSSHWTGPNGPSVLWTARPLALLTLWVPFVASALRWEWLPKINSWVASCSLLVLSSL